MWFLLFNGIIYLTFKKIAFFEYLTFPIVGYILFLKYGKKRNKINLLDLFVILLLIWTIFTWVANFFYIKPVLIIRHIISGIAFMLFYYVGRNYEKNINILFQKAYIPLFICSIIGIYWYYFPPTWYTNKILASESFSGTENSFLELSRLRSLYPSPYEMAYMCYIVLIYMVYQISYKKCQLQTKEKIMFVTFLITLILCMMRAPITIFILCSLILILQNTSINKLIIIIPIISIIVISTTTYILSLLESNTYTFIYNKFISVVYNIDGLITNRLDYGFNFSLIGDGAGKHAIHASKYGEVSINDSEYVKYIVEQGYIGFSILIFTILIALYKSIKNFKYLSFEFCIILFYAITMIGANSISTADKHCFIFWLIIGRISSYNKKNKLLYI